MKIIGEEDSLDNMLPESYLDSQIESTTENIRRGWIKDGENGKGWNPWNKEKLRIGMKKMKWAVWEKK